MMTRHGNLTVTTLDELSLIKEYGNANELR